MIYFWWTVAGVVLVLAVFWYRYDVRMKRRVKLAGERLNSEQVGYIRKNVGFYELLPEEMQVRLEGLVKAFLAEKRFEGCGGLEITEEIKVTIAAQACILILNQPLKLYPKLETILVYPHSYVHGADSSGIVQGESWQYGPVILSWDDTLGGGRNVHDGHNVVMHEFAHQLDQEDGYADGTPILHGKGKYSAWTKILAEEYEEFEQMCREGKGKVMNEYGATNPAEFFAVATETFFEKPEQMQKRYPELYEQLRGYYRIEFRS